MHVSDCSQNQQRHSRRACKPVNDSHYKRPNILIQADLSKHAVHPIERYVIRRVGMALVLVRVRMVVDEASVAVRMRMDNFLRLVIFN